MDNWIKSWNDAPHVETLGKCVNCGWDFKNPDHEFAFYSENLDEKVLYFCPECNQAHAVVEERTSMPIYVLKVTEDGVELEYEYGNASHAIEHYHLEKNAKLYAYQQGSYTLVKSKEEE